jgi:uncharacterized coiled-coil protein SlyX
MTQTTLQTQTAPHPMTLAHLRRQLATLEENLADLRATELRMVERLGGNDCPRAWQDAQVVALDHDIAHWTAQRDRLAAQLARRVTQARVMRSA